jgi:exosortase/archaeosortase family protein
MMGHPALARGNLILIGSSWVNVEEACSGIRSLQTAFMVSLFFGEFHRLGWIARAALMLSSFLVAFALNFGRTVTLTYLGGQGGPALTEKWHDTVGNVAMVLCLLALWLLAELFSRRRKARSAPAPTPATALKRSPFPAWFAVAGIVWLIGSEVATAGWYASHERTATPPIAWTFSWPTSQPDFHQSALGERSRALLKYNEGQLASWRSEEGFYWQMYYLRWLPGRVSKFLAGGHYPTVCLPASGLKLVSETGTFVCRVEGLTLPFVTYLFDDGGHDVYVFHAILEDNQADYAGRIVYRQAKQEERIASVLRGERNLGQRVIGVALRGPFTAEEARSALEAMLHGMITTTETRSSVQLSVSP